MGHEFGFLKNPFELLLLFVVVVVDDDDDDDVVFPRFHSN